MGEIAVEKLTCATGVRRVTSLDALFYDIATVEVATSL